jgi:hypothetical protein
MGAEDPRSQGKWLQVRKDLVLLLAEAKATKEKIIDMDIRKLTSPKKMRNVHEVLPLPRKQ